MYLHALINDRAVGSVHKVCNDDQGDNCILSMHRAAHNNVDRLREGGVNLFEHVFIKDHKKT